MGRITCKAKKMNIVAQRGRPSIEWHKDGVPQYYCYGWVDKMTDELLPVCKNCRDNVIYAEEEREKWNYSRKEVLKEI